MKSTVELKQGARVFVTIDLTRIDIQ